MQNLHKVIIVGAGPTGLYFASKCEEAKLDYLILEGTDTIGGQISHLYPEKEVVDIPGIDSIRAIDYIKLLEKRINTQKIVFNSPVIDIRKNENIEVLTAKSIYFCEYLVIATGLGESEPRPLGVEKENECDNIIFSIKSFDHLKNKRVAIFGGGDSALDWAKEISKLSDDVYLIHRRTEFRGNPKTIENSKNLHIMLPYVPESIIVKDGKATSVTIKKVDSEEKVEIPVDFIFVNFGNVAKQYKFPFEMVGSFIVVDNNFNVENKIFAIGDVAQYENKTRRMAPGISEADKVFKQII